MPVPGDEYSPQGIFQAIFPEGMVINAGDGPTPPPARRVRWIRESDGAAVADITAYLDDSLLLGAMQFTQADPDDPTNLAQLSLDTNSAVFETQVIARAQQGADNHARVVIDSLGRSRFAQLGVNINARVHFGWITSAGGVNAGSGDITPSHPATGVYGITISPPRPMYAVAIPQSPGPFLLARWESRVDGCRIQFSTTGGVFTDSAFVFVGISLP